MNSRTVHPFRELLMALPRDIQAQAEEAYRLFATDPSYPSLRFKQVHTPPPTYSARVGIAYRAVGVLDGDTIIWFMNWLACGL